jgi:2-polyprenyl-6-methoxyphenol hydroxylase-like FAD-dependent oxidoreductase
MSGSLHSPVDVLIIGAGPTGLTLALRAGPTRHRHPVIDRGPRSITSPGGRAYSLEILDDLGAVDLDWGMTEMPASSTKGINRASQGRSPVPT